MFNHDKDPFASCGQHRPKSACTNVQADLGFCCPFTDIMDTVVYVDKQRMSRSDADPHLDLRCSHMA